MTLSLLYIGGCLYFVVIPIIATVAPDRPIKEIAYGGSNYVLTCRPTLDGPYVYLYLYMCEHEYDRSCVVVDQSIAGISSCDDEILMELKDGNVEVVDPHSLSLPIPISYDPGQH